MHAFGSKDSTIGVVRSGNISLRYALEVSGMYAFGSKDSTIDGGVLHGVIISLRDRCECMHHMLDLKKIYKYHFLVL